VGHLFKSLFGIKPKDTAMATTVTGVPTPPSSAAVPAPAAQGGEGDDAHCYAWAQTKGLIHKARVRKVPATAHARGGEIIVTEEDGDTRQVWVVGRPGLHMMGLGDPIPAHRSTYPRLIGFDTYAPPKPAPAAPRPKAPPPKPKGGGGTDNTASDWAKGIGTAAAIAATFL
jgi:hypothetical protein